jgi:hypothetical protein
LKKSADELARDRHERAHCIDHVDFPIDDEEQPAN